ncbi:MAG TPA: M1 family metallopeptidase [Longimicrobiales bacterium]|nr:M1 family metallopeptidase [Longimicrobiales bacterium]
MRARDSLSAVLLAVSGCATAPAAPDGPPGHAPTPAPPAAEAAAAVPGNPLRHPALLPLDSSQQFNDAVRLGTRTTAGRPGPAYWQNQASYTLTATIDADARRLEGTAGITYHNNSPDTLHNLHVDLSQNLHAPGAIRFEEAEVTGGVELHRVSVRGTDLGMEGMGPRYAVSGTRLVILPPQPVLPGESVDLRIEWSFDIPQAGAGQRMGFGEDLFFLAYWYPHMVVYDDVVGWHPDPFVGTTEFYHGFARYDLTVDMPAGWVVMGTGELMNADEVLAPAVLDRYRRAGESDSVVAILRSADFDRATLPGTAGRLRWHFAADSVRDVAFSATRRSNWDGLRSPVGDRSGDGRVEHTRINAFWRASAPRWSEVARYSAHSITFLSDFIDPYPWPHMTAVEGGEIIGGGMEFPMMTIMGHYNQRGDSALYYVTAHELAHMWYPMIVSTDERRYTWIDEGLTTFNENMARMDFYPGRNHHAEDQFTYLQLAGTDAEGPMMRRSAYHYSTDAYVVASYMKPAAVMVALRGVLGEETFTRAYREFYDRWAYRHPYPWDLWATFEDVSGRDLGWFWRSWYFETWALDHAVAGVTPSADGTAIVIEDRGRVPMPAHVTITFADGRTERRDVTVEHWLAGNGRATLVASPGDVVRVEIDPGMEFPDVDRLNNVWTRRR